MYFPEGLQGWEIVAASGLCAAGFLSVATVIAVAFTLFVTRERAPAAEAAKARPAAPAQPAFGPAAAAPAA